MGLLRVRVLPPELQILTDTIDKAMVVDADWPIQLSAE
jgi:hypothetical protein